MDLFGGLFDLNGDGETTMDEELLGLMMMNECFQEEEEEQNKKDSDD